MRNFLFSIASLAVLASCSSDSVVPTADQDVQKSVLSNRLSSNVAKDNWMSLIRSEVSLAKLSIPGTHDSMSINNWAFSSNQYGSIEEQLNAGARFFDLRFNYENGLFMGYHGIVKLNLTLDQVMTSFEVFLKAHPDETIIALFKKENSADKATWVDYFNKRMDDFQTKGLVKKNWNTNTQLGACRGKVLPLSRETYTNSAFVQGWSGSPKLSDAKLVGDSQYNSLTISDFYSVNSILATSINFKYDRIIENIERSNKDSDVAHGYLTYCSGASAFAYPVAVADRINPKVAEYIQNNKLQSCGWIMMDFINSDKGNRLAEKCIEVTVNNFSK